MTLGQKIKKLRIEKNLTQKDLADRLYVTFQTVSKWENDENEPDVSTLRELAKVFDCSLDYLLSEEEIKTEDKPPVIEVSTPVKEVVKETVVIHQKELHVCEKCKQDIPDDDLDMEEVLVHHAHKGRAAVYRQAYYHRDCLKELRAAREALAKRNRLAKAKKAKKMSFGWGIFGGIVILGLCLGVFLGVEACRTTLGIGGSIILSIVLSYVIFADIYCIISGSYIAEVFFDVATWSIKMPGIIFSWDIDGIAWAIAMKIGLTVLGVMLTAAVFALAVAISGALAAISFPFILFSNIGNNYANAL